MSLLSFTYTDGYSPTAKQIPCKLCIVVDVIIEKGSSWLNSMGCLFKTSPPLYGYTPAFRHVAIPPIDFYGAERRGASFFLFTSPFLLKDPSFYKYCHFEKSSRNGRVFIGIPIPTLESNYNIITFIILFAIAMHAAADARAVRP